MPTYNARQRRIYRSRSAAYLATLDASCSVDELLTLDWAALETLPHWCFLEGKQKRELLLLAGALFLAPMIQRWIDGRRIKALLELIGDDIYQFLLSYRTETPTPDSIPAAEHADQHEPDVSKMLFESGAAVLLGSIQHPVIARLLEGELQAFVNTVSLVPAQAPSPLPATVAQPLYNDALMLFDRLYPAEEQTA